MRHYWFAYYVEWTIPNLVGQKSKSKIRKKHDYHTASIWSGTVSFDHTHSGHAQPWPLVIPLNCWHNLDVYRHWWIQSAFQNRCVTCCAIDDFRNCFECHLHQTCTASHAKAHRSNIQMCQQSIQFKGRRFFKLKKTHTLPKLVYNFNFEWTIVWLRFNTKIYTVHMYMKKKDIWLWWI